MAELDFSTEAKMVLAKMSFVYEREKGRRIRLSDESQIVELLNAAIESVNQEFKRYYQQFIALLTPPEVTELVYRGVEIDPERLKKAIGYAAPSEQTKKATYRGVSVDVVHHDDAAHETAEHHEKPKRIYRGRVIED